VAKNLEKGTDKHESRLIRLVGGTTKGETL
jgi:hypothetical protein